MDETKLQELNIFTNLKIGLYFEEKSKDKEVFICGKMFEHLTQAKYSFKACEFFIYLPLEVNKLYHSEMYSDDCFNSELKWNNKFFKKVRKLINNSELLNKQEFFSISKFNTKDKEVEDSFGIEGEKDKLILQLHLFVDSKDYIAFRLIMVKYITDNPETVLFGKLLELDREENENINKIKEKNINALQEINKYEKDMRKREEEFDNERKSYIYKFSLLNEEKEKKIRELKQK
jgi:hypothetical protein